MRHLVYAGLAATFLTSGVASAQTSTETTTTQQTDAPAPPLPVSPPPAGTLSSTRTTRAVDAYGNQIDQKSTTYRNSQGVAEDSQTTTTTAPPPPPPVTTTTTTTSSSSTNVPN